MAFFMFVPCLGLVVHDGLWFESIKVKMTLFAQIASGSGCVSSRGQEKRFHLIHGAFESVAGSQIL